MIFVSVGTHEAPFDRMLRVVYELELDEQLVVQHGPSAVRCARAQEAEFLAFDDVVENVRAARAVVMHAGVGSVMISLASGKRPIVFARRKEFGEHVDDHQVELARRLEASGLVTVVNSSAALADALARDTAPAGRFDGVPWLGDDLRAYLEAQLGPPLGSSQIPSLV
jgi:UDP-N-acetylglucosamine--N-acetylmuramyl-(pentapeptide) pyrophosphoryl-undecaprenol N-acetylglucosamine transferase